MTADPKPSFAALLSSARKLKDVSLRDAAKETGISNAYISQLESGAIDEPSPHKLRKLAEYYGLSYTQLMDAAGYLAPASPKRSSESLLQNMVLDDQDLTFEEAIAVASFLAEYRRRGKAALGLKATFTVPATARPTEAPKPAQPPQQIPQPYLRKPSLTFGVTD